MDSNMINSRLWKYREAQKGERILKEFFLESKPSLLEAKYHEGRVGAYEGGF